MVRSLPLRSGFFATPQLSSAEELELLTWGRSLIPELFHMDADWSTVSERKQLHVWEDRQKGGLTYSVRSVASVKATLDDIMDMFIASSSVEFRALMQIQLRDHYGDSAVLYHKEQNDTESLSIKWFAMKSKKMTTPSQDFCVLEYAGVIGADAIGGDPDQPIGVCLYESIEQMECPSLYDSHRLERGSISKCGFIFRPREEGFVEAQFVCSIRQPPKERGKRRLNRHLLMNWAESVGLIEESLSRKRISRDLMLRRSPNWVHDRDRPCCYLCMKTFTNTRRKHHCRACGEVICRHCSMYRSVDLQTVGVTTLRVCKACNDGTNKADKEITSSSSSMNDTSLPLPRGIDDTKLRDAVEEYALALPSQQISTVPDLVGLAWLRQVAQRDPSKADMVSKLMERIRLEEDERQQQQNETGQVDIYDTLCDLAAQTLSCKYAVVSLIDENRQWFKSAVNVSQHEVPRDFTFCEYPVRDRRPLVVMDAARDPRFMNNPFITGSLNVRFLAGAPLFTVDNQCVGSVCVMDTEPRESLQENQIATMQNLAHLAMVMVQERREAQAKLASKVASSSQLVAASRQMSASHHRLIQRQHSQLTYSHATATPSVASSSDLVPLHTYAMSDAGMSTSSSAMVVQQQSALQPPRREEDPMLKEQMMQLLQKASQVRDQVTRNTAHHQQAGLQSQAE